ncbi:HD-GYP domain-containing protein [Gilvimarinus sp. 1_MG-2023]|uniref:HD-GYP domain-containing protein n=1 Tax=Gilvimarinus sp. 1_MG-2023 TaxID=3062638 RepID=UPI0026E131B5|nr:HD-GYP domain-containing protein [Gilvimarinus sp. 1_MG-2023]MDO6747012.1 HD-GYP domain-containing protein [Gilvimarinus sp. 1_MG-2023]
MTDFRQIKPGFYDKSKRSIKISVSELRVGMYVSKLDRDWLDTPFLMQGFLLESQGDIETVAEYCQHVWVDAVEPTWVPPEERGELGTARAKTTYINKISAEDEHRQATGVFREARRLTKTLVDDIRLGGTINNEQAKATVKSCVDSILRNPDALLWMTKIRNQDNYTAEHCLNVCILAIAFGRHLGLSEAELETLGLCGLLHDVGKMRIPDEVLNKPGKLSPKEWKQMKAHVIHGRNLLLASPGVANAAVDVAYSHHERMDGNGYPRKLTSAGISEFSRIISIVDAYDAMTAERCYAPAITTTQALKNIYQDRATHFDERLALAFIKSVGLYPPGSIVELKNGYIGIVLEANKRYRHLPKVILLSQGGEALPREKIIDLEQVESGKLDDQHLIRDTLADGAYGIFVQDYREKGLVFRG